MDKQTSAEFRFCRDRTWGGLIVVSLIFLAFVLEVPVSGWGWNIVSLARFFWLFSLSLVLFISYKAWRNPYIKIARDGIEVYRFFRKSPLYVDWYSVAKMRLTGVFRRAFRPDVLLVLDDNRRVRIRMSDLCPEGRTLFLVRAKHFLEARNNHAEVDANILSIVE